MRGKEILRRSLPLVIIAVGVLGAWWLIANRPRAQRERLEVIQQDLFNLGASLATPGA